MWFILELNLVPNTIVQLTQTRSEPSTPLVLFTTLINTTKKESIVTFRKKIPPPPPIRHSPSKDSVTQKGVIIYVVVVTTFRQNLVFFANHQIVKHLHILML